MVLSLNEACVASEFGLSVLLLFILALIRVLYCAVLFFYHITVLICAGQCLETRSTI